MPVRSKPVAGERYKRTGEILPDSAIEEFKKFDSIFLGAIGHPDVKPGILEVGILLRGRRKEDSQGDAPAGGHPRTSPRTPTAPEDGWRRRLAELIKATLAGSR